MQMQSIHTRSLTSNGLGWLANSSQPRILHIFDRACNMINERGEILSIVTRHIGNGPFNLVIENDILFVEHLDVDSLVTIQNKCLRLGTLVIGTAGAELWHSQPNWNMLHTQQKHIFDQLTQLQITNYLSLQSPISKSQFSISLLFTLSSALAIADILTAKSIASRVAGLGIGLTPSGDDFILGALYAAWIIHPPEIAQLLAREVANTAAPLTTSLSAAWLKAAGNGEAGFLWHEFFNALIGVNTARVQSSINKIRAVGETSGADALAGFLGTLISYAERETKPCHS